MTPSVAIAGAGPVGLSLALALARSGVHSVVLEKKVELDHRSRATLIVPRTLAFFKHLGVLDALLAEGQRNDAIRILRASDRKPMLTFDFRDLADRTPTPFAVAVSQDRTERILLKAVQESGLVDVRFDTPLQGFQQRVDGVTISTSNGHSVDAQVLVGADGAHSAVRAQLGWGLEGRTYPTRALLADVRVAPEADTNAGWLANPDAPSFTIAIRFADGVWRIIEAAVTDELTEDDLFDHARKLAEGIFGAGTWRDTIWTAAYRKHERRAHRYVDGRVVLAGDAAHLNSPAGGQGMNAGLADVELLARELVEGLAKPGSLEAGLHRYQRERIRAFDEEIRGLTDGLEKMETLPAWARSIAFSAVGLARAAGIEKLVARRLSMLEK